jgi:hypothetical protein
MSENEQNFPLIANVTIRWRGEVISVQAPVDRGLKIFTITAGAAIAAAMLGLGWMMGTIEATRFLSPALTVIGPIVFVPFLLIGSMDYEFLIDKAAGTLTVCMRVLWRARFKRETMPFKDVVRIGLEKRSSEGHVDQVFSIVTRTSIYTVVWINTLSKSAMNDLASFLYLQCKEPR